MGISATIRNASDDYIQWYDFYAGMFNLFFSVRRGSSVRRPTRLSSPTVLSAGASRTSRRSSSSTPTPVLHGHRGLPRQRHSVPHLARRRYPGFAAALLAHQQQCFRFAISLGCNSDEGGYFDNVDDGVRGPAGVPGRRALATP
jgi:hypothetical protein